MIAITPISGISFKQHRMNGKLPRKKVPVKSIFHHVIRAKLYAVLTMNALEGMMLELSHALDQEYDRCT